MILPLLLQLSTAAALRVVSVQAEQPVLRSPSYFAPRSVGTSTTGPRTIRFLVVPIRFAEQDSTFSADSVGKVFDGNVPTISARKFMQEQSHGLIDVDFRVLPWMLSAVPRDSLGLGYALKNTANEDILKEVFPYAKNLGVNWADYDNDKDGLVEGLMLVFAGRASQETSKLTDPQRAVSILPKPIEPVPGVFVQRAVRLLETEGGNILLPGGIVHELSHTIGAADLYDRNQEVLGLDGGVGTWDLMCNGSRGKWWTYDAYDLRKPIGVSAFSRMIMGWMQPKEIESSQEVRLKPGESARLWTDSLRTTEYLLLENRDRSGVDSVLPGPGLSVYRVRTERLVQDWTGLYNTVNSDSSNMGVEMLEASGQQRISTTNWSKPLPIDLFGTVSDTLNDIGPVPLKVKAGKPSGAWLRNIHLEGQDMVFQANPAPNKGYGLELGSTAIGTFTVPQMEFSILMPVKIPTAGRVVALKSVLPQRGLKTCVGIWDSLPNPSRGAPVAYACDTGGFVLDFKRFHHDLVTQVPVKAGQTVWIGQYLAGANNSATCAGTAVDAKVDTTWIAFKDGTLQLINLRVPVGILVQTDSGNGGTLAIQTARSGASIQRVANRIRLDGAIPGETVAIALRDLRGRILWSGNLVCDASGAGLIDAPLVGAGLAIFEAKGSFGARSQVLSGI